MSTTVIAILAFIGGWFAHSTGWHLKVWNKVKAWWADATKDEE